MNMLENLWLTFEVWILSLGTIGILMVILLAVLHPTLEGPAAILLLTVLTIFLDDVWLASAILWVAYTIGFTFFYYFIHWLHQKQIRSLKDIYQQERPLNGSIVNRPGNISW